MYDVYNYMWAIFPQTSLFIKIQCENYPNYFPIFLIFFAHMKILSSE